MRSSILVLTLSAPLSLIACTCNKSQDADAAEQAKAGGGDGAGSAASGSASRCPKTLTGEIVSPVVIGKDCGEVVIDGRVDVHAPLTLEAGARLVANDDAELVIGSYDKPARLLVEATAEEPATITAKSGAPGAWRGVRLDTAATRSKIDHLTLEFAGAQELAALSVEAADVTIGALTVRSSKSSAVALELEEPVALTSLTVDKVGAPALRTTAVAATGVVAIQGEGAEAHIISGDLRRTHELAAIGVPWVITYDLQVGGDESTTAALTVAAGAELRFTESGALTVGYYHTGKLVLAGEPGAPIVLGSARETQPGAWRGLQVAASGTLEAKHLKISGAGRDGGAAIELTDNARATLAELEIDSSTIGVRASWNHGSLALTNTAFTKVPLALEITPELYAGVGAGNRYDAEAIIAVLEGTVERDLAWSSQAATVELRGNLAVERRGKLVIPGGKYRVVDGVTIAVGYYEGATLELQGSAEQPVEIVGVRDEPGVWGPITVYGNAGTRAVMQHVVLGSVGGAAGVVVEDNGSVKIDDLRCDRCAAALQWSCAAKVEHTGVSAGVETATALLAPEGC